MPEPAQEFSRLLERYFDGTLSAEERADLERRLRDDPDARQAYWEAAEWHATLSAWGEQHAGQQEATREKFQVDRPPSRRRRWLVSALAAAAIVVVGFFVARFVRAPSEPALAEVSFQRDASLPRMLRAREYAISRGAVRFETAAGASVSVAAPARFKLTAADRIELSSGQLTARMLRPDARLTVRVRDMEVTDLGTAFGVDANAGGQALVSVFDGLVAVKTPATAGELHLSRGESLVQNRAGTPGVTKTGYNALAFRELWPLTAGIDEASNLVEFLPPGPLLRPLRDYRANDHVFLFPERQSAELRETLALDLSSDVRAWPESPTSPYPVARGERAHSYLVFFQPDPASPTSGFRRLTGEITFQRRVIGVICSDQGLDTSDGLLGVDGVDYSTPGQRRGLEEADKENPGGPMLRHDSIRIGPDGRTVHFDFHVSNEREQMRVLVSPE
jgi:ferric-dicitrate binding protein FerR (iron transport regulator)